ncbi:MAG: hypothetical protein WC003_11470 [Terrimicrobiaceae bacterium]
MKKRPPSFLVQALWVFVVLSLLQLFFYAIGSGATLPGGGYTEFFLRKLIALALLALLIFYAAKWWGKIKAWWNTNPRIRLLFQSSDATVKNEEE